MQRNLIKLLPTILIVAGAGLVAYSVYGAGPEAFRFAGIGLAVAGLIVRFWLSKRG